MYENLNAMMVYACRYVLPRSTYAVNDVCTFIKEYVDVLKTNDIRVIINDIENATLSEYQCDKDDWSNLLEVLKNELTERESNDNING